MRVKTYLFAVSICCLLPFMAQGVDLERHYPAGPPPRAQLRSISLSPIMVETASGMLTLCFNSNLDGIGVSLQQKAGKVSYSELVDTSVQDQIVFAAPAGSYILTITSAAGNVIKQDIVDIP